MAARGAAVRLALGGAVLGAAALAATPLGASASVGTGVGADPIVLTQTAQPGQSYALPALYLVNTGTETSRYAVHVARIEKGQQRAVPAAWIVVPAGPISLAPKAAADVPLTLDVPANAAPGDYMTDVVAATLTGATGSAGASLGTQAATQLRFSIGNAGSWLPWPPPGWVLMSLLAAVVVVGGVVGVRRSGLRFNVERRR